MALTISEDTAAAVACWLAAAVEPPRPVVDSREAARSTNTFTCGSGGRVAESVGRGVVCEVATRTMSGARGMAAWARVRGRTGVWLGAAAVNAAASKAASPAGSLALKGGGQPRREAYGESAAASSAAAGGAGAAAAPWARWWCPAVWSSAVSVRTISEMMRRRPSAELQAGGGGVGTPWGRAEGCSRGAWAVTESSSRRHGKRQEQGRSRQGQQPRSTARQRPLPGPCTRASSCCSPDADGQQEVGGHWPHALRHATWHLGGGQRQLTVHHMPEQAHALPSGSSLGALQGRGSLLGAAAPPGSSLWAAGRGSSGAGPRACGSLSRWFRATELAQQQRPSPYH